MTFALLALLATLTAAGTRQPAPPASAPPAQAGAMPLGPTNRELLAWWYLEADAAWARKRDAGPVSSELVAQANRAFDSATLAFFRLDIAGAIQTLSGLQRASSGEAMPLTGSLAALPPLALTIEPRVCKVQPREGGSREDQSGQSSIAAPLGPVFRVTFLRPPAVDGSVDLQLVLTNVPSGTLPGIPVTLTFRAGEQPTPIIITVPPILATLHATAAEKPAIWEFALVGPDRVALGADRLVTSPFSFDELRKSNAQQASTFKDAPGLAAGEGGAPADAPARVQSQRFTRAAAMFLARNSLLTDAPSRNNSAQFLADYAQLPEKLARERDSLQAGKIPYPLAGRWWTSVQLSRGTVSCWFDAPPPGPAVDGTPLPLRPLLPLLILLHGAGGDESMFMFAYGRGALPRQAIERGMVVLSVNTTQVMGAGDALDALIDAAVSMYPIDERRVYVVGHSMGAGAAAALARRPRVAAAVCFAGGQFPPDRSICPTLLIAGGLDPLIPAARLRLMFDKAVQAGLPIEMSEKADQGHTLIVGDNATEALDFLERHRLPPVAALPAPSPVP